MQPALRPRDLNLRPLPRSRQGTPPGRRPSTLTLPTNGGPPSPTRLRHPPCNVHPMQADATAPVRVIGPSNPAEAVEEAKDNALR